MPYKRWQYLEKVSSADFQAYLQDQVVSVFTSTTQRDAQIVAPVIGMMCYVTGVGRQVFTGTAWISLDQPRGIIVGDGTQRFPGAANTVMPLPNVIQGPASWLAGNTVTLPADAGGLYLISLYVAGRSNTVVYTPYNVRNAAGVDYTPNMIAGGMVAIGTAQQNHNGTWLRQCVGGDTFRVYHAGNAISSPDWASVIRFSFLRVADTLLAT